ncbi:hypothetical protein B0H14DRAFT_2686779, partial [Mycena olivaceomarginata]
LGFTMPPPNNSVAIRVGTTIISALFALWWSVAFSSVFLVSRHFFSLCFLSVAVACLTSTLLFFFHCLGHLLGCIHTSVFLSSSSAFYLFIHLYFLPFLPFFRLLCLLLSRLLPHSARDDRGSLDLDRVRSLRLAYSFGVITVPCY